MKEYQCPAIPENLRPVLTVVGEEMIACGTDTGLRQRIFVILEELFNNVAIHAYEHSSSPGPVRITLLSDMDSVQLQVADQGVAFNPLLVDDRNRILHLDNMEEGHAGIFLVRTLASQVAYERDNGWNRVTVLVHS